MGIGNVIQTSKFSLIGGSNKGRQGNCQSLCQRFEIDPVGTIELSSFMLFFRSWA